MSAVDTQILSPKVALLPRGRALFAYIVIFLLATCLWTIPINRPLDLPSWHEFDDAAMARNFVREPSSILSPRIDWRGDGPGFVESELPLYPWLISRVYQIVGTHIVVGRVLSIVSTLGSLILFMALARSMLPEIGALTAVLFFAVNRVINFVSSALQPEAFMLFFYLAAVLGFLRWRSSRSRLAYVATILGISLAILEKSTAIHLGIFFLLVLVWEEGWSFLKSPWNWCLAVLSLVLPVIWYVHAFAFWKTFGNSLGISNENHWIDWDIFQSLNRPLGLVLIEILFVFALGGLVLVALGGTNRRSRRAKVLLLWCGSIWIYYLITIRTTGGLWAWYYHVVSVPPVALLSGLGLAGALNASKRLKYLIPAAAVAAISVWLFVVALDHPIVRAKTSSPAVALLVDSVTSAHFSPLQYMGLLVLSIACVLMLVWVNAGVSSTPTKSTGPMLQGIAAAGLSAYLFLSAHLVASDISKYHSSSPQLLCANHFKPLIPDGALLVASGGACADTFGHKVAFDAPHMFYWLDRKGFSICEGEQSIGKVLTLINRGATYFVAEKAAVLNQPGFETALRSRFKLISQCEAAWLFDLRQVPEPGQAGSDISAK